METARIAELHRAIEAIGRHRFGTAAVVADAKHQARAALIAFGQQPLPVTIREAASHVGHCLDDIAVEEPNRDWEPLLRALQVLEREIAGLSRS